MKQFVKLMSLVLGAVCLVLLPKATSLEASAATYQLKFIDDNWCYVEGSEWPDDPITVTDAYYLTDGTLQDGDTVVINCSDDEDTVTKKELKLNKNLANLTFTWGVHAVVYASSVTNCTVCQAATAVVNGNVTNAYIYNECTAQFNSNVTNMYVLSTDRDYEPSIACAGEVANLIADCDNGPCYEYYNFQKGTLKIKSGRLQTTSGYSETPVSSSAATTTTTTTTTSAAAAGEYDDVPKTGESQSAVALLLGTALVCMVGALCLRKRSAR